ncbi:hypothetical protein AVL61_15060 [Kocuria rosea subsp. polaris]|uniref:PKD domain-containing protein n=1 Tax=Kocuria rosea subsp. polaris TaxID=136273 RepID=A0A0W8I6I3_KOCRO|nr:PxKF domain-containing protein [Kocuria polaris]KUG53851.1 hypothetical protein AVL61_15060 [Kocuria polaris]
MRKLWLPVVLSTALTFGALPALTAGPAAAVGTGAVVSEAACTETDLSRNDDGSSPAVELPFEVDFYGQRYEQLWVNNNGNVTFDQPLSTYTPFGLDGTNRVIVAPFFGDVDTRGSGSDVVRYGYGTTTFEGRPAFCVNWLEVGYYPAQFDKLNSFQLLLVDRSDRRAGDVDIVFNYDGITWEAGDASGGSDGLGGAPARVGFSNGSGQVGTNFELVGSGQPGAFLDTNPATGLVNKSVGSTVPGRYVFEVRNGTPPPQTWVAMGDSYQAGVGTNEYYDDSGECQRSPYAYAPLLGTRGAVAKRLEFLACSGATTDDLYNGRHGEPPQFDQLKGDLGKDVGLVTLGIGGNDMGFAPVLTDCILTNFMFRTCEDEHAENIDDRFDALAGTADAEGLTTLQKVYRDVRFNAYRADTMVLTYPKFFPVEGGRGTWTSGAFVPRCQNLRVSDQLWINDQIRRLDTAIVDAALTMGVRPVDLYDAPEGRELCNPDGNETFLNGVTLNNDRQDSFHPTRLGFEMIADRLEEEFSAVGANGFTARSTTDSLREELVIHPEQTLTAPYQVPADSPAVGFSTSWPGSDVVMRLRSPSGRVIDRDTAAADVVHQVAPTQELYYVQNPEAGEWTIELYGADVAGSGEPVTLSAHAAAPVNQPPVAEFDLAQDGRSVTLDGRASHDPDGEVVRYIWEFDDGTVLEGPVVTHKYAEPGEYLATLTVVDDRESVDVATAQSTVVISAYEFTGFENPVKPLPTVNAMKAGRAVPLRFGLGGDQGMDILVEGSPASRQVDCDSGTEVSDVEETVAAGSSTLQYDPATDRYTYVWKTSAAWAGQCRNMQMTFDDGSSATVRFKFR